MARQYNTFGKLDDEPMVMNSPMKKMVNWSALPRTMNPEDQNDKYMKYLEHSTTKYRQIDPVVRDVDQDMVEPYMRAVADTPREEKPIVKDDLGEEVNDRLDELEKLKIQADDILRVLHASHDPCCGVMSF